MIRPLKLIYTGQETYGVENHRHERLDPNNNTNKGLGIISSPKFWNKLLSHPITALGYNLTSSIIPVDINPKFSKHDVIRALDFWIEHWVYQNQVESVLTETVNVDHEITLKELILVREKIMKMPVKTKFTRSKIRPNEVDPSDKNSSTAIFNINGKIVFTEAVFVEDSSLDPFCHRVVEMTREEYENYINSGIKGLNGLPNTVNIAVQVILNSFATTSESIRAAAMFQAPTREERFQIGDLVVWNEESNSFIRANGDEPERIRLSTETQTPEFLRWVTTGTFVIPEDTHLIAGDQLRLDNPFRDVVLASGTVAEDLHPGDIVTLVTLNNNSRWRKVELVGADFPVGVPAAHVNEFTATPVLDETVRVSLDFDASNARLSTTEDDEEEEPHHLGLGSILRPDEGGRFTPSGTGPDHLLPHSNLHPGIPTTRPYENMVINSINFSLEENTKTTIELFGPDGPLEITILDADSNIMADINTHEVQFIGNNRVRIDENIYELVD